MVDLPVLQNPTFTKALELLNTPRPAIPDAVSEEKRVAVERASEMKRLLLDQHPLNVSTALQEGNDLGQNPYVQDIANMSRGDFIRTYGEEAAMAAEPYWLAIAQGQFPTLPRSQSDAIKDTALGVGAGFTSSLGSIAAFGAGVFSDEAGAAMSGLTTSASNWIRNQQSYVLKREREEAARRQALDQADINTQYEKDVEEGKILPGLRRFGREMVEGTKDLYNNPILAGDLTAEGVGSLGVSTGMMLLAARGAAKMLLKNGGMDPSKINAFLSTPAGKAYIQNVTVKGIPISIGALEGGGAYTQVQNEIQNMSEKELLEGSPEYKRLREQGATHEDARNEIANRAALQGGAIQAVIGGITGKLVAKFESNPFSIPQDTLVGSLRNLGRGVIREATEEGIQGGSASVVGDVVIKNNADVNREVGVGAGFETAKGAVAGAGTAGAVRFPSVAESTIAAGGGAVLDVVAGATIAGIVNLENAINGRREAVDTEIDDSSPVGTRETETAETRLSEVLTELDTRLSEPVTPTPETVDPTVPESSENVPVPPTPWRIRTWRSFAPTAVAIVDKVRSTLMVTGAEVIDSPASVYSMITEREDVTDRDIEFNRIEAIRDVMREFRSGNRTEEEKTDAALWLYEQAQKLEALREEDLSGFPIGIRELARESHSLIDRIMENPDLVKALERAQSVSSEALGISPTITDTNVDTPEVQNAVKRQVLLSQSNPAGIDPEFVNQVLNQRKTGKINLRDNVAARLRAAVILLEEGTKADTEKAEILQEAQEKVSAQPGSEGVSVGKTQDIVRQGILHEGRNNTKGQFGLSRHLSEIVSSLEAGNTHKAQTQFDNLRNFGEHMQNKVRALNESVSLGRGTDNKVPFRTWTGSDWLEASHQNAGTAFVNPNSPRGMLFAREAGIDADTVATFYNNLLDLYSGQLTGSPLEVVRFQSSAPVKQTQSKQTKQKKEEVIQEPDLEVIEKPSDSKVEVEEPVIQEVPVDEKQVGREEETSPDPKSVDASTDKSRTETDPEETGTTREPEDRLGEVARVEGSDRDEPKSLTWDHLAKARDGLVRFIRAYHINPEKSVLMQNSNPLKGAVGLLRNVKAVETELNLDYPVKADTANKLANFLAKEGTYLLKRLNERLTQKAKTLNSGKLSPLEALDPSKNGGKDYTGFKESRSLNLVDPELGTYDPRLAEAGVLAALQWVLSWPGPQNPSRETVGKLFGVSEEFVTDEMMEAAQYGFTSTYARESLARNILEFWGTDVNKNAPLSDTRGIVESFAAELLTVMEDRLTEIKSFPNLKSFGDGKSVRPSNSITADLVTDIRDLDSFLPDVFIPESEKPVYFDQVPETIPTRQKGNEIGTLSKKVQRAVKKLQEQKFYRNTSFVSLMQDMGETLYKELLGYQEYDPDTINNRHARSIDGKNNSLNMAWRNTMRHNLRLEHVAGRDKKNPDEVASHFDWFVGRNGRMMSKGFSPQLDKTMREAFVTTVSELDMTTDEGRDLFWLTVAQSSGLVKTEKGTRADNVKTAEEKIYNLYPETIGILSDWIHEGRAFSDDQRRVIKEELNKVDNEITSKLLHSLLAVAQLRIAESEGEGSLKSFKHNLSLEADGKTDGPINAMMHFLSGPFDGLQIKNLMKGGFFPNQRYQTLNAYLEGDPEGDLYQTGAAALTRFMGVLYTEIQNTKVRPQMDAMLRILTYFGDLELDNDTGKIVIGRSVLKNPLTITVYGSGATGIAGKIASAVADVLGERMSELAVLQKESGDSSLTLNNLPGLENYKTLGEDLRTLVTRQAIKPAKKPWFLTSPEGSLNPQTPQTFELSQANMESLRTNIKFLFVDPMMNAIDETTGHVRETMKLLQAATQVQSTVFQEKFQDAVEKMLKEKRKSGELDSGDFLSEADYNKVFKEMSKFGAVIETVSGDASDAHHVNVSVGERVKSSQEFGRGLNNEYSGNSTLPAPRDAKVSASPMLVISRGDAEMMVNYYASQDPSLRTLEVFDGLEVAADEVDAVSEAINQAVMDGWLENPLMDAAQSFADFTRQGKQGSIFDITKEESLDKLERTFNSIGMIFKFSESIEILRNLLNNHARSIEARKRVMKKIGFSIDHMASGENPALHDGVFFEDAHTPEEISRKMNKLYEIEIGLLEDEAKVSRSHPAVEAPSKEFKDQIDLLGQKLDNREIVMLHSNAMKEVMSKGSRQVSDVLLKALPNFTFLFGSSDELTNFRNENYPEHADAAPIELGQTDFENGIIYVTNIAPETVLHEMLHAVTGRSIFQYVSDPDRLPKLQRDALANLETLMEQFRGMNFTSEDVGTMEAAFTLSNEIESALAQGTPEGRAVALSEFVSWSLSNQKLVEVLRVSKVRTPLRTLVHKVLQGLRRLLGLPPGQSLDMFSNILWNTGAVIRGNRLSRPSPRDNVPAVLLLNQRDPYLNHLLQGFERKIAGHLRERYSQVGDIEDLKIHHVANQSLNRIVSSGFRLNPQQQSLFKAMQAALASTMEFDKVTLVQVQKLFTHVTKNLSVESFMQGPIGPNEHPSDRLQAEDKFNAITGAFGLETDFEGRSTLMATFLALSQVDPTFRRYLANVSAPKIGKVSYESVDEALNTIADATMNFLSASLSTGLNTQNQNVGKILDQLSATLAQIEKDDRTLLERQVNSLFTGGDTKGNQLLEKAGGWIGSFGASGNIQNRPATLKDHVKTSLRGSAKILESLLDANKGKAMANALTEMSNKDLVWKPIRELINEVIGITDENRGVFGLINKVKYEISKMRQEHREVLPKVLAEKFSRKLSKQEWSSLHLGLAKSDIAVLGTTMPVREIRDILKDPQKLNDALNAEIDTLGGLARSRADSVWYQRKAKQLAQFMVKEEIQSGNHNLLRNATAIAHHFGEGTRVISPSLDLINSIDRLTTLYALDLLDPGTNNVLSSLSEDQSEGLDFLIYYLADLRQTEMRKVTPSLMARINGYKGYVPSEKRSGSSLLVQNSREHNRLTLQGYTRVGSYDGSGAEHGNKGYYFSTVGGNAPFNQAAMQTVHRTAMGVDPRNGRTIFGITGGIIEGHQLNDVRGSLSGVSSQHQGEPLMPIYDGDGRLMAYERSLVPAMLRKLDRNTQLDEMVGAWAGRQAEEDLAESFNQTLVDRIFDVWDRDRSRRSSEFVNLADPGLDDAILKDAWKIIPANTKEYIQNVFGDEMFMVRKDMLNNALGYRESSIGEAWIGPTRMTPAVQKAITDVSKIVLGKNAFKYLVTAEKAWQAGVSVAKNTIVVRSIIVPAANLVSNVLQLMVNGVNLRDIFKGFSVKLVEIDQHLKNLDRLVALKAEMARYRNDRIQLRKLEIEKKNLEDSSKRMSIWPLIEAGEFSTISEGLTEADAAIAQGKWADYIKGLADKVPSKLGTVGRYGAITRDTSLFKGMARSVQYGDFLGKAVLYDHLIKNQKLSKEKSLEGITEEFVNYNLLPGRTRSYAETMGLTWFWSYKIRSIKVAHKHLRDHPLRAFMSIAATPALPDLPGISVGSPISDNAVSVIADGRAGYSLGPGMMVNALEIHPWVNLAN